MAANVVIRRYHAAQKLVRAERAAVRRATEEAYAKAERDESDRLAATKAEAETPKPIAAAPAPATTIQPSPQQQQHNRNHRR